MPNTVPPAASPRRRTTFPTKQLGRGTASECAKRRPEGGGRKEGAVPADRGTFGSHVGVAARLAWRTYPDPKETLR